MVRWIFTWALCLTSLVAVSASPSDVSAQAPVAAASKVSLQPAFDLVSIRPMGPADTRPEHIDNPPGSGYVRAVNVNLKSLMEIAYDIPDLRMFGGPNWLTSTRFFLEAKADPEISEQLAGLPKEQAKQTKRLMMAALLTEHFNLAVHTETKEMPVYAMLIAKGGPKLDGAPLSDDSRSAGNEFLAIKGGSDSLQILAYELSWRVGRPVLDRTGLKGNQPLTLRWRDDEGTQASSEAPSLFTALQEQLGLRLQPAKSPVPVLVIDHADKPVADQ